MADKEVEEQLTAVVAFVLVGVFFLALAFGLFFGFGWFFVWLGSVAFLCAIRAAVVLRRKRKEKAEAP